MKHETFLALSALFNRGHAVIPKKIADRVLELAIELFPDFRMTASENERSYTVTVENLREAKNETPWK